MAITGTLRADFSSFYAAVNKAEVELKSFEGSAGKVSGSLQKMANSFSGQKIIADATLMAKVFQDAGGKASFTAAELQRMGSVGAEAAAKMRALGMEVPPGIAKIAGEARTTGSALNSLKGIAGTLAGAFGLAFSIGAVVNFGKKVFDTASEIHDMATKLGISTDAVQGFKFAAEQTGSSLDSVGTAINFMNKTLAGGDKSTVQALKDAGLKFTDIRNLKVEDAFLAISDAIQKIPDPMMQARVQTELFGRGAADLLPGMKEGFRGLADSVSKMSADTINSLEAAQDAWEKLGNAVVRISGTIIAHAISAAEGSMSSWRKFAIFADNAMRMGVGAAMAMADATQQAIVSAEKHADAQAAVAPHIRRTADEIANQAKELNRLESDQNKAIATMAKATKDGEAAWFKFKLMSVDAVNQMSDAIHKKGLPAIIDLQHTLLTGLPKVTEGLDNLGGNIGEKWGQMWNKDMLPKVDLSFQQLKDELKSVAAYATQDVAALLGQGIATGDWSQFENNMKQALSQAMGSAIAGAVNFLVPGLGTLLQPLFAGISDKLLGALGLGTKGRDLVKEFAASFLQAGDLSKGISGFDRLHQELNKLGAEGERLWINLTQGVGKNNPAEAAKAIDAIRGALAKMPTTMGDIAGDAGFKTKAELEQIAAEAVKLWEYMRDSGLYTAEAVQQAWERAQEAMGKSGNKSALAAEKVKTQIAELDSQIKSLEDSIANEAAEEVMGVVEAQTRAKIAGLKAEREEASKRLEELTVDMTDSMKAVADAINAIPDKIIIDVQTQFSGGPASGAATGGVVGRHGIEKFSSGGVVGTDRVPALLTPGELILNAVQQRNLLSAIQRPAATAARAERRPVQLVTPNGRVLWTWLMDEAHAEGMI